MILIDVEKILSMLHREGASEAEVYLAASREVSASFSHAVEDVELSSATSLGIRAVVGKRQAVVGTQDLSPRGVEEAVRAAVSMARAVPEDPWWRGINERIGRSPVQGLFDPRVAEASPEDAVQLARLAIQGVGEGSPSSRPVRGSVSLSRSRVVYASSLGGPLESEETYAGIYLYAKASEGGSEGSFGDHQSSRSLDGIDARGLGIRVGRLARSFVGSRRPESGAYDLILAPKVLASFVETMLPPAISALHVQQGRSPLAGRLGSEILSSMITVVDEGTAPGLLGSREFDSEGHPTGSLAVFERGVLKSYLYDSYTAKKEGRNSTGNAWRSFSGPPAPGPNHMIIVPGGFSQEEMICEVKRGLIILGTIGEWLSNPVSGSLNATITNAYLVENGEIRGPVNGGVISGNMYEMLGPRLAAVGREVEHVDRISAPPVLVRGITVAGE